MNRVTDQTGRWVDISDVPKRIISVVPSQTELLFDLGLENEVIGITSFCVHPEPWFRTKTRVGGTKKLKLDLIRSLTPDLILANKEENEREQIEALAAEFPVWVSDIHDYADAKEMILSAGRLTGRLPTALRLLSSIDIAFDQLAVFIRNRKPLKAAYLIWNNPFMAAGGDTFISSMMEMAGFSNAFGSLQRYPVLTEDELLAARPDLICLSSEPFPFKEQHAAELRRKIPGAKVLCVDGELFSWYGSRMLHSPNYFHQLFEQIKTVR